MREWFSRALSLVFLGVWIGACGSVDGSAFDDATDTDAGGSEPGADASTTPPIFSGGGGDSGTNNCPSNVLCGAQGLCCPVGSECVSGACASACASGVRCAAGCCTADQVCLSATCTSPGAACTDSFDCADTDFCEPTIGKCLPQPPGGIVCEVKPPVLPFDPVLEWSWTGSTIHPTFDQVINMPVVMDLDGDGTPEVVIVTNQGSGFNQSNPAYLRVLDGKTGTEKWGAGVDAYLAANQVNPRGTPAVADLDGDGTLEIIVPKKSGGVLAFDKDGKLLWSSKRADGTTAYNGVFNSVTVAIADMNGNGKAEIVLGGVVFDYTGKLVSDTSIGREKWGANDASYGPVSIIADVDGNLLTTDQYVVTGNRAIRRDGTLLWDVSGSLSDGYPAIADLDVDGTPELIVVAQGKLRVQNATTGALIEEIAMPGTGRGGPPTVADFDNDGVMEMAAANGTQYAVFEYDPMGAPKLTVKWNKPTQDGSSNVTGSSVFDFEGDGSAEVVYNDECYARIYKGTDGTELKAIPNTSATIHEYPVLVDVDGDNNTEFVVAANDGNHLNGSPSCPMDVTPRHGVFAYGDKNDKWVRTRRLWNQHAYHLTNVLASGKIPNPEARSFTAQENNNYRVSSQGKGVYNAPDLGVDLEVSTALCPNAIILRARVKNEGSLGAPAGIRVRFYAGSSSTDPLIEEKLTSKPLLPGQSEVIESVVQTAGLTASGFFVTVDEDGAQITQIVTECKEDNNASGIGSVRCPTVK